MKFEDERLKLFIDEREGTLYSKLDNNLKTAFEKMVLILLEKLLPFMPMFIRYFTDHGAYHSKEVARIMDELITKVEPPINSNEAFILLASAWLHDIGMLNNIDPQTGEELSDDKIREKHGKLSAAFIEKNKDKLFHDLDSTLKDEIKFVCKNHTTDIEEWNTHDNDNIEWDCRTRLLISILRLADILDIRKNRAPEMLSESIKLPDISSLHWEIYKTVKGKQISNYVDEKNGHNSIRIEIIGAAEEENKTLRTSLFCHIVKKVNVEINNTKAIFEEAGVFLPTEIIPNFRVERDKKQIENLDKCPDYYFNEAKRELFEIEYEKYNNPLILIDLCMEMADRYEKTGFETKWRKRAGKHFTGIMGKFPLTGYWHVRKYQNDIKMKESANLRDDEKLFISDMVKINKTIGYISSEKSLTMDTILGPLILLRFGMTPYRQELKSMILATSKNRIIEKNESQFSVHNECNLCTGRVLSLLSFLIQFKEIFHKSDFEQIDLQINRMVEWLRTQKEHRYGTIKNKPSVIDCPRYTAAVQEGLLDLLFFKENIENLQIKDLIGNVFEVWWNEITKIDRKKLEEPVTLIYGKFFRSMYFYYLQFKEDKIKQHMDDEKNFWKNYLDKFKEEPLISRFEGWEFVTCWDLWKDPGMQKLSKEITTSIRKDISESEIWSDNGSWGNNNENTKRVLEGWLFYWEHYWRHKEAEKIEGVSL